MEDSPNRLSVHDRAAALPRSVTVRGGSGIHATMTDVSTAAVGYMHSHDARAQLPRTTQEKTGRHFIEAEKPSAWALASLKLCLAESS